MPEGKIRLVREVQAALPSFCIVLSSCLRGQQASTAFSPRLQPASILLDTLMLENKSEPGEVRNSLTPASSWDLE